MNEDVYRLTAIGIFVMGAGISVCFSRRADRRSGNEKTASKAEGLPIMVSLRLVGMALWLGVLAYLINPAWMTWAQISLPVGLRFRVG